MIHFHEIITKHFKHIPTESKHGAIQFVHQQTNQSINQFCGLSIIQKEDEDLHPSIHPSIIQFCGLSII
jgi:hypothetical protein